MAKKNGLLEKLIIFCLLIYVCYTFAMQERTLIEYKNEQKKYTKLISEQKEYKQELQDIKNSADSKEYIEQMAREKLDMYNPNERVYIDIQK